MKKDESRNGGEIKPVLRDKDAARKFYDRISRLYDLFIARLEKKYRRKGLKMLDVEAGDKILEMGFGTGHALVHMAERVGPEGKIVGVDISPKMLEIARKKLRGKGLEKRVELYCEDGAGFEYESSYFTGIFICFTLELFTREDMRRIIGNCRHLLKPGGRICLVTISRGRTGSALKFYEKLHMSMPAVFDCRPIYPHKLLLEGDFAITASEEMSMWGLPVEIVLAEISGPE